MPLNLLLVDKDTSNTLQRPSACHHTPETSRGATYLTGTDAHRGNEYFVAFTLGLGETGHDLTGTRAAERVPNGQGDV